MKTKRIGIISGLLVLMFILVASASAQPPIIFPPLPPILSKLTITPAEIERGDNVTIGLDIENMDSQSFTYIVTIHIGNVNDPPPTWPPYNVTLTIDVELGAYESKTVSQTITLDAVGDFNVTVDGLTGSFTVISLESSPRPAEFVVSDLFASPDEVEEGEGVTFSVKVTNIGETEGSYTVEFKVDGETIETEIVTLARGESTAVSFEESWSAGTYQVSVEDLTETFNVSKKHIEPFWMRPDYVAGILIVIVSAGAIIYTLRRHQVTKEVRSW